MPVATCCGTRRSRRSGRSTRSASITDGTYLLTVEAIEGYLRLLKPNGRDLVALRVTVEGKKGGKKKKLGWELLDYYDEKNGISAMMRTTGYSLSLTGLTQARRQVIRFPSGLNDGPTFSEPRPTVTRRGNASPSSGIRYRSAPFSVLML